MVASARVKLTISVSSAISCMGSPPQANSSARSMNPLAFSRSSSVRSARRSFIEWVMRICPTPMLRFSRVMESTWSTIPSPARSTPPQLVEDDQPPGLLHPVSGLGDRAGVGERVRGSTAPNPSDQQDSSTAACSMLSIAFTPDTSRHTAGESRRIRCVVGRANTDPSGPLTTLCRGAHQRLHCVQVALPVAAGQRRRPHGSGPSSMIVTRSCSSGAGSPRCRSIAAAAPRTARCARCP